MRSKNFHKTSGSDDRRDYGRPTSETNPFGGATSWTYANNNWLTGQTLANGETSACSYDPKAQVTELLNKDGGGNILSNFSSLTYDAVGNRTALTANIASYTPYSRQTSYSYDIRDELITEASTGNAMTPIPTRSPTMPPRTQQLSAELPVRLSTAIISFRVLATCTTATATRPPIAARRWCSM